MIWQFDLSTIPIEKPVLFFLAEDLLGSQVHAGRKMKCANGYLVTVGCYFASDAPQILAWRPMVASPGRVEKEIE